MVHRGQDAEVAVGDRDASVLEPALLRPPRGPARLALRNLGLVELQEVRPDDRAVELPADAAEVGEDGGQARQRWVEQLTVFLLLLIFFCCFACLCSRPKWDNPGLPENRLSTMDEGSVAVLR